MVDELLAALDRLQNAEILAAQSIRSEVVHEALDDAIKAVETALDALDDERA